MSKSDNCEKSDAILLFLLATWFLIICLMGVVNSYIRHYSAPDGYDDYKVSNEDMGAVVAAIKDFDPLADSLAQWSMAGLTFIATIISALALVAVFYTWKEANSTARAAIEANRINSRQFELAYKPWLIVKATGGLLDPGALGNFSDGQPQRRVLPLRLDLTIANYSEMPAIVVYSEVGIEEFNPPPSEPNIYIVLTKGDVFRPFCSAVGDPKSTVGVIEITPENFKRLRGRKVLICGRVIYLDTLGKRREYGYAFTGPLDGSGFARLAGDQYNYDREIKS